VQPPSIHGTTWCTSVQAAGRSQPGKQQPPSRAASARRCPREASRRLRPYASHAAGVGEDDRDHFGLAGHVQQLLHGERLAVTGQCDADAGASCVTDVVARIVTGMPPLVGSVPDRISRIAASSSASCRR
jgi:hypothetical protein